MNPTYLSLTPRDPLIARDGRPFNDGQRMKSLDWFAPSVFAGSLRTMTGKRLGHFDPAALRAIAVAGGLPVRNGELYFPMPKDCFLAEADPVLGLPAAAYAVRPRPELTRYCDIPDGLAPVCCLPAEVTHECKPAPAPAFLSLTLLERWLSESALAYPFDKPARDNHLLERIPRDVRTHVRIQPDLGSAKDTFLFSTSGLALPEGTTLELRVEKRHPTRRSASPRRRAPSGRMDHRRYSGPRLDLPVRAIAPKPGAHVRLMLATPGLFDAGWLPGWLERGEPVPGTSVKLELVGVAIGRGIPISGWSLERGQFGPKPSRRARAGRQRLFLQSCEAGGCRSTGPSLDAARLR